MAICPVHGEYSKVCMKCQPEVQLEKQPKVVLTKEKPVVPTLAIEDKLTLKTKEVDLLKAQQGVNQAFQTMNGKQNDLVVFIGTMFEKYGLKQEEWVLDVDKAEFVKK